MSWLSRVKNAVVPNISLPKPDLHLPSLKDVAKPAKAVVSFTKDTFDKAVDNPVTRAAEKVIRDPKDAFRDATREGLRLAYHGAEKLIPNGTLDKALTVTEKGLDVLDKGVTLVAGKDSKAAQVVHDLARVDFEGISRNDGLKGDWMKLWGTWLFEEKPASLGKWDKTPDGRDRVTVTDKRYLDDLANRPHQKVAQDEFLKQHPNPKVGDTVSVPFGFTGEGSASGDYTAVEWFIGSYNTKVTCTGIDEKTGQAKLEFEVTNDSSWHSATRLPQSFQDKGLPENVIDNTNRDRGLGLGGTVAQRYVWTKTVDVPKAAGPAVS